MPVPPAIIGTACVLLGTNLIGTYDADGQCVESCADDIAGCVRGDASRDAVASKASKTWKKKLSDIHRARISMTVRETLARKRALANGT